MTVWFTAWLVLASAWADDRAQVRAESFTLDGRSYVRLLLPAGEVAPEDRLNVARWKAAAFSFALDEMVARGTFGAALRDQIERFESPTRDTGYVVLLSPTTEGGKPEIVATLRIDRSDLPGIRRLNALIDTYNQGKAPAPQPHLAAVGIGPLLGYSPQPSVAPFDVFEAKNLVVRSGEDFARSGALSSVLIESAVSHLTPPQARFGILETDLGGLSEFYVRRVGGWRYLKVYSERTGQEVPIPPAIRDGSATDRERLAWIREVGAHSKDKAAFVALLGLDRDALEGVGRRAQGDLRVREALGSLEPVALPPPTGPALCRLPFYELAPGH